MSDNKIFFKCKLTPTEYGLEVWTDKFISIHETECFHFCVLEYNYRLLSSMKNSDETELQYARRKKILKRIDKNRSRIAFETLEKALEHLKLLKRSQLEHMKRDSLFIEKFLSAETLEMTPDRLLVPNTRDLVRDYIVFD